MDREPNHSPVGGKTNWPMTLVLLFLHDAAVILVVVAGLILLITLVGVAEQSGALAWIERLIEQVSDFFNGMFPEPAP